LSSLRDIAAFLLPWEFSPALFALCFGSVGLYVSGLVRSQAGERPHVGRRIAFFAGWLFIYAVMQTRYDYLSQHMFFIHRLQHLALHHLGPFLLALSLPLGVMARGLPDRIADRWIAPFWSSRPMRAIYRAIQHPVVAPVLFVGLIYFWLNPTAHFDVMLSARYYAIMNWSMLLDGMLFWALVMDPRSREQGALTGFGTRIWMVLLAIPAQILIGAYISLSEKDLYPVYHVCGRVLDFAPRTDQILGGIVTWIPASMMHGVAAVVLIGLWMRADRGPVRRHPGTPDQGFEAPSA
jgi:putative membrane protein